MTSKTVLTPIYNIKDLCGGRFAIMPHPQGGEHLINNIEAIKAQGFEAIISMLTHEEQIELGLEQEKIICEEQGIAYLNFPIRDEVADSDEKTLNFIDILETLQKDKRNILFHCRGGVGRSSMMLSLLATRLGVDIDTSFELITKSRGEIAPESQAQKDWVTSLANDFK